MISSPRSKTLVTLCTLLALMRCTCVQATEAQAKGRQGRNLLANLSSALELTPEQIAEIKAVIQDKTQGLEGIRTQLKANRAMLKQMAELPDFTPAKAEAIAREQGEILAKLILIRTEIRAQVLPLLTPEQRTKAKELTEFLKGFYKS